MALWTPEQITTELWLDAADISSITSSSGTASQWNDKSGNNRHATQSDSAKRPGTGSVTQNSKNVLVFDGSNDFFIITLNLSQPRTYYVVAQTNVNTGSTGSRQYVFDGRDSAGINRNLLALRGNQTNKPSIWSGSWLPHANNTTTEFDLFRCTFNGSSSVIGINADDDTGAAGSNNQSAGVVIGSNYAYDADFLNGCVAEILICSASDEVEGYLAHKWGISAKLAADHPYKLAAPVLRELSGVVAVNSSPAQRTVLVYKNDDADLFMSTQSDATTGEWQAVVGGEETDRYRVVMVGESGEYSKVFEDVTAG